jgi:tetratricopeptide (TPR) repeat protein
MKKIIIYFSLILSLALNIQCKKSAIDKPVYGTQSNATFYKTDAQIKQALTGVYLQLRTTWNEYAKFHYFVGDVSTDDAWKGGSSDGDYGEAQDMSNFILTPTNGLVAQRWSILYNLIARANEVIAYAPAASGDKSLITQYINEAKLLRAFGYYALVTTHGEVPLVITPLIPSEATSRPKSSVEDVFAQIEKDLTDASALPASTAYSAADKNRVSRGTALALLGKAYMFQLKYTQAEATFRTLVTSGDYSLLPDYGANWRGEFNAESIFVIDSKVQDKDIALGSNIPHFFTTRNTPGYQGYGFHVPTEDLFSEFAPDDPRITYTFTRTGDRYLQDTQDQDNAGSVSGFQDRKTEVPQYLRAGFNAWMVSYNVRLIRYSDVLLMFAEALNENGKGSEALIYLNQVRKRARETPPMDPQRSKQAYLPATNPVTSLPDVTVTGQTELRAAIWHERRCELGMEGWRREDLVRQKRFGPVMRAFAAKYKTLKGQLFNDSRDNLFPIPQNDIDYSNGVIKQNPGY